MSIFLAVVALALFALTGSILWAGRVFLRSIDHPEPHGYSDVTALKFVETLALVDANRQEIESLTIAVSEGIAGYKRHEARVQKTVTSARRLIRESGLEHAGIEAEYAELHDGDEAPSEPEGVLPLQPRVDDSGPSGIPGLTVAQLEQLNIGG